jgi:hypothetical protein
VPWCCVPCSETNRVLTVGLPVEKEDMNETQFIARWRLQLTGFAIYGLRNDTTLRSNNERSQWAISAVKLADEILMGMHKSACPKEASDTLTAEQFVEQNRGDMVSLGVYGRYTSGNDRERAAHALTLPSHVEEFLGRLYRQIHPATTPKVMPDVPTSRQQPTTKREAVAR